MAETQREVSLSGWRPWMAWSAGNAVGNALGIPAGLMVGAVVGTMGLRFLEWVAVGAVLGSVLGAAQWVSLRNKMKQLPIAWIATSSAGMAAGYFVTAYLALESKQTSFGLALSPAALIDGWFLGVAQWLNMRRFTRKPRLWPVASAIGYFLGNSAGVGFASGWRSLLVWGAVFGIFTGAFIPVLQPTPDSR